MKYIPFNFVHKLINKSIPFSLRVDACFNEVSDKPNYIHIVPRSLQRLLSCLASQLTAMMVGRSTGACDRTVRSCRGSASCEASLGDPDTSQLQSQPSVVRATNTASSDQYPKPYLLLFTATAVRTTS